MAATSGRSRNLRTALLSACGLIGISGATAEATEIRTGMLVYTEPNRVSAFEALMDLQHEFDSGKSVNFKLVLDTLTGASANGAAPWTGAQTFTTPSGSGTYSAAPGTTPLDDTFKDTRMAVSGGLGLPLDRLTNFSVGLYGSGEHDYTSLGANTSLSRDFNKKNTTLAVRAAIFRDTVSPEGGRPEPLAFMASPASTQPRLDGNGTKDVLDMGLGLTQVIDKSTIVHLNYTYSHVSGYQTDPYKVVSLVDATTGAPLEYRYENRPEARTKHVLFGKLNRHLGGDIARLTYRYMKDDWGIKSHTVGLDYQKKLGGDSYLEPSLRYYTQTAADFYRYYLVEGESTPQEASADYRLGKMETWAFGLKYGRTLDSGHQLTISGEYYRQTGNGSPADAIGELKSLDLFPTVEAFIIQVGYSLEI